MEDGGRRRARRTGMAALTLLFASTAATLALARHYHLDVAAAAVAIVTGLPALYLGWMSYRDSRRDADKAAGQSLADIAKELAGRLGSQWSSEAEARRLNDPYPLPVAWIAADAPLAGDLDAIETLATTGAGWSASARETWAKGPEDLAGGGDRKLADVLAAVPTGRLAVLGDPGSGKTMLMVGLMLDLLARRASGGPVPVLASLASWNPHSQDLHEWLGDKLITEYPDLANAPPPGSAGSNRFEALVEGGLILPVLDGLDEIPESARPRAITRINEGLKPGEHVVVTCRTEQYRAAVSAQDGLGAALGAAAVQLSTLPFGEVARYLRTDAGPASAGRWDFLDALSAESPVRRALATPLMAGLARAIYNPRSDGRARGERATELPHPAELCDFTDRAAVEAHLFDAFIPAAYLSPAKGRWTARQAEIWLAFLAWHLEYTIGGPEFAWWQLHEAVPRISSKLPAELAAGLAFGLTFGLTFGLAFGLVVGLAFGLVVGLVAGLAFGLVAGFVFVLPAGFGIPEAPAHGVRIGVDALVAGLVFGFLFGFAFGLPAWFVLGLPAGLVFGFGGVLAGGLFGGLVFGGGLSGAPVDLAGVTNPRAVLARDRRVAPLLMLTPGLAAGLAFGFGGVLAGFEGKFPGLPAFGVADGLVGGLAYGLVYGLAYGLAASMRETAWPSYMLARAWLALHHLLPWSLMSFLADAHQRGVLKQAGAVYQFRHLELQRRLATYLTSYN